MGPILTLLLFSLLIGALGKDRPFGFWGFFFLSLLVTPLIALLLLVLTASSTPGQRRSL